MHLKNYNEDLVMNTVKIVLRDRPDIKPTRSFILDVAAYALNRIPPKYITSERGFTRELIHTAAGENGDGLVNVIELITLINRAVDVVGRRRRTAAATRSRRPAADADVDGTLQLTYFYNMPHIFGRLVSARDGSPVIAADATLFVNDSVSVPAEPGWQNPYRTSEQTKGYFSFWPQAEMGSEDALRVELSLGVSHSQFKPLTFHKIVKVPGEFFVHDYIRGDKLMDLGSLHLDPV
jgi:competence protein ComFB